VLELATHFGDEIMAPTNIYYLADRKRSFELLMQAFKNEESQGHAEGCWAVLP